MQITVQQLELINGLQPHKEFFKKQFFKNLSMGEPYDSECNGTRQTGKTTFMILKAISLCSEGQDIRILVKTNREIKMLTDKFDSLLQKTSMGYKIQDRHIRLGSNTISIWVDPTVTLVEPSFNEHMGDK